MAKPEILETGFRVDEEKLRAVEIPVEEILISEIEYNLDIPYLEREGTDDWNLTPRELIENFEAEATHARRVEEVELRYPIDIYFHKGKWIILDGVHRFTKAVRLGRERIKVRRVTAEIARAVRRDVGK